MNKKNALGVVHVPYNSMGKMLYTSKDSGVGNVIGLLSGKYALTAPYAFGTGSGSGLLKVALSSYFVNYPAIVGQNLMLLRTTGWGKCRRRELAILQSDMQSMMPPISTRMGVC